jgi:hypothetical protein
LVEVAVAEVRALVVDEAVRTGQADGGGPAVGH